jgi:uncharacterized glyoxalase superfamily protein PhnB
MNSTPQHPNVWPAFRARDARALIDFLVEAFGFVETVAYEEGVVIHHAQLDWPEGGGIMLGQERPGTPWARDPGTSGAYVVTSRDFIARDPEGNLWSFGTYAGEPRTAA